MATSKTPKTAKSLPSWTADKPAGRRSRGGNFSRETGDDTTWLQQRREMEDKTQRSAVLGTPVPRTLSLTPEAQQQENSYLQNDRSTYSDSFTTEEYAALSDNQRALADAQTLLWNAIQEDKTNKPGDTAVALSDPGYSAAVADLFSEAGGSTQYAPRTVATLTVLGMKDQTNDLDNYLSGRAFLSKQQIMELGDQAPTDPNNAVMNNAWNLLQNGLNAGVRDLLNEGQNLLNTVVGDPSYQYAQGMEARSPLDQLSGEQTSALGTLIQGMSLREQPKDLGNWYQSIKTEFGVDPTVVDQFILKELEDWELNATDLGADYLSPAEFRAKWMGQ